MFIWFDRHPNNIHCVCAKDKIDDKSVTCLRMALLSAHTILCRLGNVLLPKDHSGRHMFLFDEGRFFIYHILTIFGPLHHKPLHYLWYFFARRIIFAGCLAAYWVSIYKGLPLFPILTTSLFSLIWHFGWKHANLNNNST